MGTYGKPLGTYSEIPGTKKRVKYYPDNQISLKRQDAKPAKSTRCIKTLKSNIFFSPMMVW